MTVKTRPTDHDGQRGRRKRERTAFEGQYLLWGRSIGRSEGQEGKKRLIEKDSEMLTADRRQQGSGERMQAFQNQ